MWYNMLQVFQPQTRKRKGNMKNTSSVVLAATTLAVGVVCGYLIPRPSEIVVEGDGDPESKTFAVPEVSEAAAEPEADAVAKTVAKADADADSPETASHVISTSGVFRISGAQVKSEDGKATKLDPDTEKRLSESMEKLVKALSPDKFRDASADVLADIDTSWMSAADLAIHNNLQSLLQRKAEAETEMMKRLFSRNKDGESRLVDNSFEERMRLDQEIKEAYLQERDLLLRRTSDLLGYSGEDSEVFVATINDIYKATTPQQDGHHVTVSISAPVEGDAGGAAVFGGFSSGNIKFGN